MGENPASYFTTRRRLIVTGLLAAVLVAGGSWLATAPLLAKSAAQSAVDYRELGLRYQEQGQLPAAIAAFQKAVEFDPKNLSGRVNLGWAMHLAGQDRQAAQVLRQTIPLDPDHVQTFNALGIIYLMNDDLVGAVMTHTWAVWLKPDNEIAFYNRSLAFQRLKQYDWAIADAKKSTELEPDNPHPWVALAIAYWQQGNQKKAEQAYQQAIEVDPRYSDSDFLNYLNEAGFSAAQISQSKQVLKALP
jgi:Flp pilus assembly protein TadD